MGTGKSVVAKEVASKLQAKYLDLDDLIATKEGRQIKDIFAKEGEPYFRQLEKNALKEVAFQEGLVVACGGGIVLDAENIEIMKKTGKIICLSARPEVILERTSRHTHRPLLNVDNPKEKIEALLKIRQPFYALSDETIDTSDLPLDEVVAKVLKTIKS